MALVVKERKEGFDPVPAGNHPARCIWLIELGTQYQAKFDKASPKVRLAWELPMEKKVFSEDKGEEPFVVGRTFTASLGRNSALRPMLESWRGRAFTPKELEGFDLRNVVGKGCLLNIVHETDPTSGRIRAQISAISPLPKGMSLPDQCLPSVVWELSDGLNTVYAGLPEWLRKTIGECQEWQKPAPTETKPTPVSGAVDMSVEDDTPF